MFPPPLSRPFPSEEAVEDEDIYNHLEDLIEWVCLRRPRLLTSLVRFSNPRKKKFRTEIIARVSFAARAWVKKKKKKQQPVCGRGRHLFPGCRLAKAATSSKFSQHGLATSRVGFLAQPRLGCLGRQTNGSLKRGLVELGLKLTFITATNKCCCFFVFFPLLTRGSQRGIKKKKKKSP